MKYQNIENTLCNFFPLGQCTNEQAHEQQQEQTIFSQFLHKAVADYIFHLPFVSFKDEAHKLLSFKCIQ